MTETESRLASCFQTVFPHLAMGRIPQAAMTSVRQWDSLATITLVSLIEEEFGIDLPPSDLERFDSFGSIARYLEDGRLS